jgi:hypothetical protein
MRPNLNIAPVEWPYRETVKSPGDVVITNIGRMASPPGFRPSDQAASRLAATRFNPFRIRRFA